jgi:hypothetical protein
LKKNFRPKFFCSPGRKQHLLLGDGAKGRGWKMVGAVAAEVVAGRVVKDELAGEESLREVQVLGV